MQFILRSNKPATPWREWRGLAAAFIWFFCSMYSFYDRLFEIDWVVFAFMLLLCGSLLVFGSLFGRSAERLGRIALFTTPAGAVCTALIPFAPQALCVLLFWLSAVLMAPLLSRRLYGVVVSARPSFRFRLFTLAVSVTIAVKLLWDGDVFISLGIPGGIPFDLKFPILAMFALLGIWGIGAGLPAVREAEALPRAKARPSARIIPFAAVVFLLFALNVFNSLVHTHIVLGGWENNDFFLIAAGTLLPAAGFFMYACFTDAKREKMGFMIAMSLILLGCVTALLPSRSVLLLPMIVADELGATAMEYYLLTMPLMFFDRARQPVLAASFGLAIYLFVYAIIYMGDHWIPAVLAAETMTRPLVIFGAVCVALLVPLAFSLWDRQKEQSLIAGLLGLKQQEEQMAEQHAPQEHSVHSASDWTAPLELMSREHEVALMLCQGKLREEIAAELHLPAQQITECMASMQAKLNSLPPVGRSAVAMEMAARYKLTGREAEVFDELLLGRSNQEIAAALFVVEATVKFHVRNILRKTGAANRSQLIARLDKGIGG